MTLAATVFADLEHELASTRTMLSRVPAAHLDYSPHPKSWSLRKLATHLTDMPNYGLITITTSELAFDGTRPPTPELHTAEEFVALFDSHVTAFRAALAAATDEALQATWTATFGGQVVMAMPRVAVLRNMVVNHMIHHRAQLSIYYRLLDVPLPPLYGPTADER